MKSIALGLALSLLGGVASAQTPPQPTQPLPAQPSTGPAARPTPPAPPQAVPPEAPQNGARGGMAAQNAPPEGEIIETPNGFYLVRPGQTGAQRLDMSRGDREPRGAEGQAAGMADGDEPMDDMAENGMRPSPVPHPHRPPPPRPPDGKGARLRIHTPSLNIGVKCPDDEPIKACVDAVSQLLDKATPQGR